MNKFQYVKALDNGVLPHDGLNYLEVTTRVYTDRQGRLPPAEETAFTVIEALGGLLGSGQSVMVDTRPVTLQETEEGWLKSPHPGFNLTTRRTELAGYIARGLSNREIANELNLAEATIKRAVTDLARVAETPKRSGIAPVFWGIVLPHLLDHSRMPKGPVQVRRKPVRP